MNCGGASRSSISNAAASVGSAASTASRLVRGRRMMSHAASGMPMSLNALAETVNQ